MRLVVIRPEPGCTATVAAARALGLEAIAAPLFEIVPLAWQAPDVRGFDAVVLASANAARHAGPQLGAFLALPCLAVGEASAAAARAAGFGRVSVGADGVQALAAQIPAGARRVLRIGGRERTPLDLPRDIELIECAVYASEPLPLGPRLAASLPGALVLLHSRRAARHFVDECQKLGIDREQIALAALSPAVAAAAGPGWAACHAAAHPTDTALLAMAGGMCNIPASDEKGPHPNA